MPNVYSNAVRMCSSASSRVAVGLLEVLEQAVDLGLEDLARPYRDIAHVARQAHCRDLLLIVDGQSIIASVRSPVPARRSRQSEPTSSTVSRPSLPLSIVPGATWWSVAAIGPDDVLEQARSTARA